MKKENKTEEYRTLARREMQSIDAAIPTLKYWLFVWFFQYSSFFVSYRKEEDLKKLLKEAEDAQQTATNKRKVRMIDWIFL